ncbi:MAG: MerR family DNA-binding protein [Trueperaceae bacterium]|nr:MerR family DNA-binding protein [Trueperaceae bacterium]
MRIGELARATGETVKTLRYWHDEGVLEADRSEARYREFAEAMIERVAFVRRAQALGFTLADVREVVRLRREGERPCAHVRARLEHNLASVRARLDALHALERELAGRVERARAEPARPCDDDCVYLDPLSLGGRPQAAAASARASAPVTPVRKAR